MAAKGSIAKDNLINKFISILGEDYIGCFDKKYYFWSNENGERVQVCVSMTCPKTPVGTTNVVNGELDFSDNIVAPPSTFEPAQISDQEKENIKQLMEKLGL